MMTRCAAFRGGRARALSQNHKDPASTAATAPIIVIIVDPPVVPVSDVLYPLGFFERLAQGNTGRAVLCRGPSTSEAPKRACGHSSSGYCSARSECCSRLGSFQPWLSSAVFLAPEHADDDGRSDITWHARALLHRRGTAHPETEEAANDTRHAVPTPVSDPSAPSAGLHEQELAASVPKPIMPPLMTSVAATGLMRLCDRPSAGGPETPCSAATHWRLQGIEHRRSTRPHEC